MSSPTFTSLVPASGPVQARALIAGLKLAHDAPSQRPYTVVNMICSVDGRAAFGGVSRAFSDPGDRVIFHALRERVDAVLAGTTTMREERYGRLIAAPQGRERRIAAGASPEPLAVLISASGAIPLEIPLFAEADANVVVFSPQEPSLDSIQAKVHHEPLPAEREHPLADAMAVLRSDHGVETLLCEGGPSLFGSLLHERLVDELFLTLSPTLAGGDSGPTITSGPPLAPLAGLELRSVLQLGAALYLRYRLGG